MWSRKHKVGKCRLTLRTYRNRMPSSPQDPSECISDPQPETTSRFRLEHEINPFVPEVRPFGRYSRAQLSTSPRGASRVTAPPSCARPPSRRSPPSPIVPGCSLSCPPRQISSPIPRSPNPCIVPSVRLYVRAASQNAGSAEKRRPSSPVCSAAIPRPCQPNSAAPPPAIKLSGTHGLEV